jgi:DNA-binding GntR family transcriptional regulator
MPERLSVRDQVLGALRAAIVSGELGPGSVHSAPALAARYEVSATPVREAMQLLSREGAVEVLPNRGFRIARRSARDLAELAEVRALLEVPVLAGLCRTVPAERWRELRPLAQEGADRAARGDRAGYAEADVAFHCALLALSGNLQLVAAARDVHRRALWPAAAARPRPGALAADAAEHTALLDALAAGDACAVERLARAHLMADAGPRHSASAGASQTGTPPRRV